MNLYGFLSREIALNFLRTKFNANKTVEFCENINKNPHKSGFFEFANFKFCVDSFNCKNIDYMMFSWLNFLAIQ